MKPLAILCSVVIFLLSPSFIYAQSKSTPKKKSPPVEAPAPAPEPQLDIKAAIENLRNFRETVKVSVTIQDSNARDQISSYLKRELRSFKDVDVVDNDPSYEVAIVGITTKTRGGYGTGYALSVSFLSHENYAWLKGYLKPEYVDLMTKMPSYRRFITSLVSVGSTDDLQSMCRNIIAAFDSDALESGRQMRQKFIDNLEKNR